MSIFESLRERIREVERLEREIRNEDAPTRQELRRSRRNEILDQVVPTRICPICESGPYVKSRSWVILSQHDTLKAVCVGCYRVGTEKSEKTGLRRDKKPMNNPFLAVIMFNVDPVAFRAAREATSLSRRDFSTLAALSEKQLRRLEEDRGVQIGLDQLVQVNVALRSKGVIFEEIQQMIDAYSQPVEETEQGGEATEETTPGRGRKRSK